MNKEIITIKEHNEAIAILHLNDVENKNTFTENFINLMIDKLTLLTKDKKYKAVIIQGLSDISAPAHQKKNC